MNNTIKCYHYTRLLEEELIDINNNGLHILNNALIDKKVFILKNFLSNSKINLIKDRYLDNYQDADRPNRIHLTTTSTNSNDEEYYLVEDLLNIWGGDMMYSLLGENECKDKELLKFNKLSKPVKFHLEIPLRFISDEFDYNNIKDFYVYENIDSSYITKFDIVEGKK